MAAADKLSHYPQTPRLLLLHRLPTFKLSFLTSLATHFTVLDPFSDPPHPSFSTLSKSARVMLCMGPTPVASEDLDRYPPSNALWGPARESTTLTSRPAAAAASVSLAPVTYSPMMSRIMSLASGSMSYAESLRLTGLFAPRRGGVGKSMPWLPSDALILCCALTDETYHIVNKDVMTALGKTGILVNIGCGFLVDENELVRFLVRHEIGGAGLDVFEQEPGVPDELFTLDNVVLLSA